MTLSEAKEQILEAQAQIKFLQWENEKQQNAQEEFQNELIVEVEKINKMGGFKRWFFRGKLLFELIYVIQRAISRRKT